MQRKDAQVWPISSLKASFRREDVTASHPVPVAFKMFPVAYERQNVSCRLCTFQARMHVQDKSNLNIGIKRPKHEMTTLVPQLNHQPP